MRRYVDIFILNNASIMVRHHSELFLNRPIPGRTQLYVVRLGIQARGWDATTFSYYLTASGLGSGHLKHSMRVANYNLLIRICWWAMQVMARVCKSIGFIISPD